MGNFKLSKLNTVPLNANLSPVGCNEKNWSGEKIGPAGPCLVDVIWSGRTSFGCQNWSDPTKNGPAEIAIQI